MPLQAFPNPLPGGEGAACPLMTSYPVDLFFGFLTRKKIPPGSAPCKQGLDLHPIVAPACDCAPDLRHGNRLKLSVSFVNFVA